MNRYHRRDFLRMGAALAAGLGLPSGPAAVLAEGLEQIFNKRLPVIWIQGLSCTGCSVSLLNSESPSVLQVLTEIISLTYHSTISAAQGSDVDKVIDRVGQDRGFLLVLEGAIPADMPEACVIGGSRWRTFWTRWPGTRRPWLPPGRVLRSAACRAPKAILRGPSACRSS